MEQLLLMGLVTPAPVIMQYMTQIQILIQRVYLQSVVIVAIQPKTMALPPPVAFNVAQVIT
jgi:hypothetical protein